MKFTPLCQGLLVMKISFENKRIEMRFSSKIVQFLKKGAVREVKLEEGEFLSCIFLVPKTLNSFRHILNLNELNEFALNVHFRIKTMDSI